MAVGPGTREVRRGASGVGETGVTLSWHPPCILQARGQVACEEQDSYGQDSYGRRDLWLRLPRGPGGRAKEVSKASPVELLGSLLGDLTGPVYFQNPFVVSL